MASSTLYILFTIISLQSLPIYSHLFLPLTHTLSKTLTTQTQTHHLLKTSSTHSTARFHRHRNPHRQISLPLSSGSDYTLSLSINSQSLNLYMDTGSDLVWFPCEPFECILCEGKPNLNPPLIPHSTPFIPCNSPACSAAHSSKSPSDLCAIAGCPLEIIETSDCYSHRCPPFYYAYGDGSLIAGLRQANLSIPTSKSDFQLHNFTFGCAHSALAEPVGVAGFGPGLLSLPAQLAIGTQFSYCLISHSFDAGLLHRPSPLILGRSSDELIHGEFVYTPMLHNPKYPYFYCVGLEGISVGGKILPAMKNLRRVSKDGNGGVVVDSGTTFTMLPAEMYEKVAEEFDLGMRVNHERATEVEAETGLGPCYYYEEEKVTKVPKVVFHFGGNASVVLPRRNYFLGFKREVGGQNRKVGCLLLMNAGELPDSGGGPAATLGNFQQQGFEVVYDLGKRRVGFSRRQCATLWDSLSRG
ncbi:eukaryotic aspartyl protease family protein [Tasmannia lanceolata]|uniref:eukaryotic aspartyl protease family protein n=1 Tax=Tasmannia lanceolata TaxID=3420 RepID=UPI0040630C00